MSVVLIDGHEELPQIKETSLNTQVPPSYVREVVVRGRIAFIEELGKEEGTVDMSFIHHRFDDLL